jgi:hypothetical protein
MMHGPEKSDPAIVAGKPTNKAETGGREVTHVPTAKRAYATACPQLAYRCRDSLGRLVRSWRKLTLLGRLAITDAVIE